ncbi:MAG: site-specific DNA-methyltransferase [Verrucomicrobia bacterium]|nr:site-specific DNA-methyltransferase [Verrucomicrobiota bacterium]MBU1694617.1 site-specific DNA-methyltransferase [Verrucomicrobiota bacterium]
MKKLRIRREYDKKNDVTLFQGDCRSLLKQIPDNSAQLVVTSPPYNVGKSYEKRRTLEEYLDLQREVIRECVRILRPGGSICWQVGHHVNGNNQVVPLDILLHPLFAKHEKIAGIRLRNRIIWHFEHGLHCKFRFSGRHETILWYTKGDKYRFNLDAVRVPQKYPGKKAYKGPNRGNYSGHPLGKNPGDVWIIPNVKGRHVEKTIHPCQFPVEIPAKFILALTRRGNLVVDPYLGVGSTAAAAVLFHRKVAGADLKKKYLNVARDRVRRAERGMLKYRAMNTPVYEPPPNTPLTTSPFAKVAKRRGAVT